MLPQLRCRLTPHRRMDDEGRDVALRLQAGESAEVFLVSLRRLAALFGDTRECALRCAFVAGLPDNVRSTTQAGSRAGTSEEWYSTSAGSLADNRDTLPQHVRIRETTLERARPLSKASGWRSSGGAAACRQSALLSSR